MQINGATQSTASSMAIFAHELREPLASILFAVQSIDEIICDNPANREMWGVVERQSRYLARIIDQVLELSRGSHDKLSLNKNWFDLGATMTNAIETVKPLITARGHRLTFSLPAERVYVMADALRVQQVVVNLLTNAAKYTQPGGCIDLALKAVDDLAVIEVHDNGAGISPELLPWIFDLFHQGAKPHYGAFSGLGIGLALVKSLVELHGGSVSAHSEGAGTGAAFVVRLPGTRPRVNERYSNVGDSSAPSTVAQSWAMNAMMDA